MAPKKKLDSAAPSEKGSVLKTLQSKYKETVQLGLESGPIEVLSTGSLALDIATGIGGYPRGRITELSGFESTGKTTHALKLIARAQSIGLRCLFLDTEWALDNEWATNLGVDVDALEVFRADSLEIAGESCVAIADSGEFDVIVFDSVAGAPIEALLEGDIGDANMGKRAKIMSGFMPKVNGPVKRNNVWMIFTNQLRSSMDQYKPDVAPGGHALPFHASLRIHLSARPEKVTPGNTPDKVNIRAKMNKNKLAPPFKVAEYTLGFDGQFDTFAEVADVFTNADYLDMLGIQKGGAWYTLPDELVAPGFDNKLNGNAKIAEMLASDLEHFEKVEQYIRSRIIRRGIPYSPPTE